MARLVRYPPEQVEGVVEALSEVGEVDRPRRAAASSMAQREAVEAPAQRLDLGGVEHAAMDRRCGPAEVSSSTASASSMGPTGTTVSAATARRSRLVASTWVPGISATIAENVAAPCEQVLAVVEHEEPG